MAKSRTPTPVVSNTVRPGRKLPDSRAEHLRAMLPQTMDYLKQRRASMIGDDLIADYVALDWLEWQGGDLKLTITGRNLCTQVQKESA